MDFVGGSDPEFQLLKYKRKCSNIIDILKSRTLKEDVEDLICTIESVIPLINRLIKQLKNMDKGDTNTALVRLHNSLEAYEETVVKLDKTGRLLRFLTSNRLRKRLEVLNSDLHRDIEYFVEIILRAEIKEESNSLTLSTNSSPINLVDPSLSVDQNNYGSTNLLTNLAERMGAKPTSQATTVAEVPQHGNFGIEAKGSSLARTRSQRFFAKPEPIDYWDHTFGDRQMIEWNRFIEFMIQKKHLPVVNDEEQKILRYVLDNSNTGLVSKTKYCEYLKGFGDTPNSFHKLKNIFSQEWFYGYLSSKEAEVLLSKQLLGTFLVRLSKSSAGSFAIAFVYDVGKVVHILVSSQQPNGYTILDQETNTNRTFNDLFEIIQHYGSALQNPFTSTIPLQSWFQGDVNGEEANELLTGNQAGTFLIRFSSQPGFYAASFIDRENKVRHTLIEPVADGFKFQGETLSHQTMNQLVAAYDSVLTYPATSSDPETSLLKIKELANKFASSSLVIDLEESAQKNNEDFTGIENVKNELDSLLIDIENPPRNTADSKELRSLTVQNSNGVTKLEEEYENAIAKLALNDKKYQTKWAYLFEDKLVVHPHTFSLWTTWIEPVALKEQCFRVVSPEKKIAFVATEQDDKNNFLNLVHLQIGRLLDAKGYYRSGIDHKKRFATYNFTTGALYEGEWDNCLFHGLGTLILETGQKYEGEWDHGNKQGKGVLFDQSGAKYDGYWRENQRDGWGVQYYPPQSSFIKYEGHWKSDRRHGPNGCLYYKDGSIIRCEWNMDEPIIFDKITVLVYSNGDKYVGDCVPAPSLEPLKVGKSGYGIYTNSAGDCYSGMWGNDKKHGVGHLSLGSGDMEFRGEWVEGKIQGNGHMITPYSDNIITGFFSGDIDGSLDIKQGVFKRGRMAKNDSNSHTASVLRGDKWKPFINCPKWAAIRKSDVAKGLDEAILSTQFTESSYVRIISKILNCDTHPIGVITNSFVKLFHANYTKFDQYQAGVTSKSASGDLHSFIAAMTTHLITSYKPLNTQVGIIDCMSALLDVLFPHICISLLHVFHETHKSENRSLQEKTDKLRKLPLVVQYDLLGVEKEFLPEDTTENPFKDATTLLEKIVNYRTPEDKINCIVSTSRKIEAILRKKLGSAIGADHLLPSICLVIANAKVMNIYSELGLIEEFLPERYQTGMEGYLLTQFQIAAQFLKDIDLQGTNLPSPLSPIPMPIENMISLLDDNEPSQATIIETNPEISPASARRLSAEKKDRVRLSTLQAESTAVKDLIEFYQDVQALVGEGYQARRNSNKSM